MSALYFALGYIWSDFTWSSLWKNL